MRSMLIFALFAFVLLPAGARGFQIVSVEKPDLPGDGSYYHPLLSPSGEKMAFTTAGKRGLMVYDTGNGKALEVSEKSVSAQKVVFSPDERRVFFTEVSYKKRGQRSVLMFYDLESHVKGEVENRLVYPPRTKTKWQEQLLGWMNAKAFLENLNVEALKDGYFDFPYARSDGNSILLKNRKGSTDLKPYGDDRYLWASLSPDGERIAAVSMSRGGFVCDVKGEHVREIGEMEAPVWMTNQWIVGMVTEDDGHYITGSFLRAVNVDENNSFRPEVPGDKVMHPSVATGKNLIACHTDGGEILLMKFEWQK
ncbi:MAG: TolB family protein [Bacteroidota bacterium]